MFRPTIALIVWLASVRLGAVPTEAAGQSTADRELQPLSAAIEEMRRSPFHRDNPAGVFADSRFLVSSISPVWLMQTPPADSTLSGKRMFLVTTGAAVVSDLIGGYLILGAAYGGSGDLAALGGIAISVVGPAAGARLAGARWWPALGGSALGVIAAVYAGGLVDPNDFFPATLALAAMAHAGVTTLVSLAFR